MSTRNARLDHHFVTWLYPLNELASFSHDAGNIASQNVRQRNLDARHAIANKNIEMIERASSNFHEHFIRAHSWLRHIGVLEHFRSTVLSENRGFHFAACSRAWYEERRAAHPEADLNLLIDRIGLLGPDPRGLAVWGIGSWGAAEPIARETVTAGTPIRPVTSSLYADFGEEQL